MFKDIVGYEGKYSVNEHGDVMNIRKQKLLKAQLSSKGYLYVTLSLKSKKRTYKISRLIAIAFIENPLNKPFVDHVNGNITDNRIENLRWATVSENCRNSKARSVENCKYKGVLKYVLTKNPRNIRERFMVSIYRDGKTYTVKNLPSAEYAAKLYNVLALYVYGEFARLNEI